MKTLSIVIPCYNEEDNIEKIMAKVRKLSFKEFGYKKEVLVVNDGSSDGTGKILKKMKSIKLIEHPKNKGKGAAIQTGIKKSVGDVIIIQDADLEYDPGQIADLLSEIVNGEDIVYGSRFKGTFKNMSFPNLMGNKFLSFMTRLLFTTSISDMETCYKMFTRNAISGIDLKSNGFEVEGEITAKFLKNGYSIKEIPIDYNARGHDEGKKIDWKDGVRTLKTLLKYRFND